MKRRAILLSLLIALLSGLFGPRAIADPAPLTQDGGPTHMVTVFIDRVSVSPGQDGDATSCGDLGFPWGQSGLWGWAGSASDEDGTYVRHAGQSEAWGSGYSTQAFCDGHSYKLPHTDPPVNRLQLKAVPGSSLTLKATAAELDWGANHLVGQGSKVVTVPGPNGTLKTSFSVAGTKGFQKIHLTVDVVIVTSVNPV